MIEPRRRSCVGQVKYLGEKLQEIPRRVYTQAHMDVVAESVVEVWDHRDAVKSLEMVYEPSDLRFFQARFEPVG
jgi:tryptophanase